MVRNPMNPNLVSKVALDSNHIDGFVFWTKNPRAMMDKLQLIKNHPYYFLFTITPYGPDLEKFLPPKEEIIDTFIHLSNQIGKEKVVWRYDPILVTDTINEADHLQRFEYLAQRLHPFTETCIISFMDMYKKCQRNLKDFAVQELSPQQMRRLAHQLHHIAQKYSLPIVTCAEETHFSDIGIPPAKCIDDNLMNRIRGYPVPFKKDKYQRKTCRCVESIDIGAYNTCNHICLYCYANADEQRVYQNNRLHNLNSPLLLGELTGTEKIIQRYPACSASTHAKGISRTRHHRALP